MMRSFLIAGTLAFLSSQSFSAPPNTSEFFETEIRPVLVERCTKCHGGKKAEAGLRLDSLAHAMRGGDRGPAVVPKQPKKSFLLEAMRHSDDLQMPPNGKLDARTINAFERWIAHGAHWPEGVVLGKASTQLRSGPITKKDRAHWAYQPLQPIQPPTDVTGLPKRNEIDAFVNNRLHEAGLTPRPPATKHELLRRAKFDLTGLPPTPEDLRRFQSDGSPDAFQKAIGRMLKTRHYGERWGRHWLDVVRYADTAGETGDYPTPLSYKYRNWVIRSFHQDKPYDQFIREQLAGDILANAKGLSNDAYRERILGTGFIAISRRFGFDVENYHHLTIQDTIDTLGQAVLGLTLGCARCHDHKYDPINTEDYYAWYGIFDSTRYSFPGSEEKKKSYDSFAAVPPAAAKQLGTQFQTRLASLESEQKQLAIDREKLAKILLAASGIPNFSGFEGQPLGQGPTSPYSSLEDAKLAAEAQSPFQNVFPSGTQGIRMPANDANNAFSRPLPQAYTPATTPRLFYNLDFMMPEATAAEAGSFRMYLGRGPGNSAAVEMAAGSRSFWVKNGTRYELIEKLEANRWYNVQLEVDLRKRTYSGTLSRRGHRKAFTNIRFTQGWDGTIDQTFVDKYGATGGTIPKRYFDNLAVSTTPLLPLEKLAADQPPSWTVAWQTYLEERRLLHPAANRDNHEGFHVWHANPLPIVGINVSNKTLKVPGTVPPGKVVVHPNPKKGVGIAWRSPLDGPVTIEGYAKDAHNCGDSIEWFVDLLGRGGLRSLRRGAVDQNQSTDIKSFQTEMKAGEFLQLAVMPKASHGCDLTEVELIIKEVGNKQRVWKLSDDLAQDLLAGNPHDDQHGSTPWYLFTVDVDRGASFQAIRPKPLSKSELAQRTQQRDKLNARSKQLEQEIAKLKSRGPYELIYGAIEKEKPEDAKIRIRGDRNKLGATVARKNLEILGNQPISKSGSGRLDLANWLTSDKNPLFARVMVNRIWQHHFGKGLVGTENDFGTRGERPSHPQLLDWLANRFKESGYSVKAMHRLIMESAAYQRSSQFDAKADASDPDSRLLWRFNRRRLSAEEIRDSILFISGNLDDTMGAAHPFPDEASWAFSQHAPFYGLYPSNKRSVYLMQQRLKRHPFLSLFDGADVNVSTARRKLTTVPTQALYLMNSEFIHDQSKQFAARLAQENRPDDERIELGFESVLGRSPSSDELRQVHSFLAKYKAALERSEKAATKEEQAWAAFARTLLTRNEFLFVD